MEILFDNQLLNSNNTTTTILMVLAILLLNEDNQTIIGTVSTQYFQSLLYHQALAGMIS